MTKIANKNIFCLSQCHQMWLISAINIRQQKLKSYSLIWKYWPKVTIVTILNQTNKLIKVNFFSKQWDQNISLFQVLLWNKQLNLIINIGLNDMCFGNNKCQGTNIWNYLSVSSHIPNLMKEYLNNCCFIPFKIQTIIFW